MSQSCLKQHESGRQAWACATEHRSCHQLKQLVAQQRPQLRALKGSRGHPGLWGFRQHLVPLPGTEQGKVVSLPAGGCAVAQNLPCQQEKASKMSGVRECEKDLQDLHNDSSETKAHHPPHKRNRSWHFL